MSAPEPARDVIALADGRDVPRAAVEALDRLEGRWPGATFPTARAAVVAEVIDALTAAGYAVVRLPEPSTDSWGYPEWIVPHTANRPGRVRIDSDGRFSTLGCPNPSPSPADAEPPADNSSRCGCPTPAAPTTTHTERKSE